MLRLNNPYLTLTTLIAEFENRVTGKDVLDQELAFKRFQSNLAKMYRDALRSPVPALSTAGYQEIQVSALSPELVKAIERIVVDSRTHDASVMHTSSTEPYIILEELQNLQKNTKPIEEKIERAAQNFAEINNRLGGYFDNPSEEIIALFIELSERCHTVSTLFEGGSRDDRPQSDDCAYKLMALFLPPSSERDSEQALNIIAAKAAKYFSHVDVKVLKPLHYLLFIKELPKRADVSDFEGWLNFIETTGVKAMEYFSEALRIEQKNQGIAPKSLQEAKALWALCLYARANEDLPFAHLCHKYRVSEKDFSMALDYMASKGQKNGVTGWPKKLVDSDSIPSVVVQGKGQAQGYYWVKLPSDDKRALILGHITSCCQHIGGNSDFCVRDACELSENGLYVLLKAKNQKSKEKIIFTDGHGINYQDFKIIGQSYVWRSVHGNLCFDSIECLAGQISIHALKAITKDLGQSILAANPEIYFVTVGAGGKTPQIFGRAVFSEQIRQGTQYPDSRVQYAIAQRYPGAEYAKQLNQQSFTKRVGNTQQFKHEESAVLRLSNEYEKKLTEVLSALSEAQQVLLEYLSCYIPEEHHSKVIEVIYELSPARKTLYLHNLESCIKTVGLDIKNPVQLEPFFSPIDSTNYEEWARKLGLELSSDIANVKAQIAVPFLLGASTVEETARFLMSTSTSTALDKTLKMLSLVKTKDFNKDLFNNIIAALFESSAYNREHEALLEKHIQISDTILVNSIVSKKKKHLEIMISRFGLDVNKKINLSDLPASLRSGATPLMLSCITGTKELFDFLVQSGAELAETDDDGHGIAFYALLSGDKDFIEFISNKGLRGSAKEYGKALIKGCEENNIEIVRRSIAKGASVDEKNENGLTAFMLACMLGHKDILDLLLSYHPNIHEKAPNGETALMLALLKPNVDIDIIKLLLKQRFPIDEKNNRGATALMCAAYLQKNPQIVELLLQHNPSVDLQGPNRETALLLAGMGGNVEVVRALLEAGANPNIIDSKGEVPLLQDFFIHSFVMVSALLEKGANPNMINAHGQSPLLKACRLGDSDTVRALLEKGANPNITDPNGESPLLIVCSVGRIHMLTALLEKGADYNILDAKGESPLLRACAVYSVTKIRALLEKGADHNIIDINGESPLLKVCAMRAPDIVRVLLDKGADPNIISKKGETPLLKACLIDDYETVSALLEKGADPNITDAQGESCLIKACRLGNYDIVRALLEKGARCDIGFPGGIGPLSVACQQKNSGIITLLLDKGVDINITDTSCHQTPLMTACVAGNREIVALLLKRGADLEYINNFNETALSLAKKAGHFEILKLLEETQAELLIGTQTYSPTLLASAKSTTSQNKNAAGI